MNYIINALIIGYFVFLLIGVRLGHKPAEVVSMSFAGLKTAGTLMAILLLIGVLTGSWRSAGSIVTFVYYFGIVAEATMAFKALIIAVVIILQSEPVREYFARRSDRRLRLKQG